MMDVDEDEALLDAVHDEYAREILRKISAEPLSGPELIAELDASKPTVYRRLSSLEDLDLVAARVRPDTEGHQRKVYVANVDTVSVHFDDGNVSISVERSTDDAVDRFTKLVSDLS
jgi:predicted transcriptional regulator